MFVTPTAPVVEVIQEMALVFGCPWGVLLTGIRQKNWTQGVPCVLVASACSQSTSRAKSAVGVSPRRELSPRMGKLANLNPAVPPVSPGNSWETLLLGSRLRPKSVLQCPPCQEEL